MENDEMPESLALSRSDYVASAAKAALGAIPFAGSLLVEIAGTVIPNQRIDRIGRFAAELEKRLAGLERDRICAHLTDENFTDLVEEGLRQAARSTTEDRRQHLANVIAASLTSEDVSFIESKHLLRLLGEVNDVEVIWLRFYLHPTMGGDEEFRAKHEQLLVPRRATMGSSQAEIDQETLQRSYKQHLERLGLLRERYKVDSKTKMPDFERDGRPKVQGYELTRLGRLFLRQLGFDDPYQRANKPLQPTSGAEGPGNS
jgi:hypothetical protein